jgi:hypothetical protein
VVYLSYCLYPNPSVIFEGVNNLELLTGKWSLFYVKTDQLLIPGLTDRIEMSPFFLETSLVVTIGLLVLTIIFLVLSTVKFCTKAERVDKKKDKNFQIVKENTLLEKAIAILYRWLLFPIAAGFWLVLSLSGYVNSRRLTDEHEGLFASDLGSSLAMLLVWTVAGCIFFF